MKKTSKILFFISFAPAAFLLIMAVASIFTGATFIFSTSYGIDAFLTTLILGGLAMCYVPILPACVIFQVVYIVMYIVPQRRTAKGAVPAEEAPQTASPMSEKTRNIIIIAVFAVLALGVLSWIAASPLKRRLEEHEAQSFYYTADTILDYNEKDQFLDGLMGIEEQKNSCIMIDYSDMRIGFIVAGSSTKYYEFELERMNSPSDYAVKEIEKNNYVQTVIYIDNGDRLIAYSDEKNYITAYMVLYRADGYVYATNLMKDKDGGDVYTDLRGEFDYPGDNVKKNDLILK